MQKYQLRKYGLINMKSPFQFYREFLKIDLGRVCRNIYDILTE